ncbi:MAG TPA: hypothetical protein VKU79_03110 [Thermoplasmataceae archaeon]|nr:hypothetical protein [Thermoplasmatales archaeon AK]HLH85838.1 hypothetical protein [Thermoplasmataceae archaeon]
METRSLELYFTEDVVRTDSMAYREKAHLLLPPHGDYNRFTAVCTQSETRFFITSSSAAGLRRMENFFLRVYRAASKQTEEPPTPVESLMVVERKRIRPPRFEYFPRLVRNILDLTYVAGIEDLIYEVTLVSGMRLGGRIGFHYYIEVGTRDPAGLGQVAGYLKNEIREFNGGTGLRLKIRKQARFQDNLFSDPIFLMNVLRIPAERENPE